MNPQCAYCVKNPTFHNDSRTSVIKFGTFLRSSDKSLQQRYRCLKCKKTFSKASYHPCYRQKKRALNPLVFIDLVSGVSQRRLAIKLKCNRKTVVRKFLFLSRHAELNFKAHRSLYPPTQCVEFDDLETFEHSKLKPLSVVMAVESGTRRILGFRVAQMPPKGHLVQRSIRKYGPRADHRRQKRESLFREIKNHICKFPEMKSDENPHYGPSVKRHFPNALHKTYKGRRGCVVGQGELKAGGFDPLFTLNHTFAMFRANINRLMRRTWNTTKKLDRLTHHIWLYCLYHNFVIIE